VLCNIQPFFVEMFPNARDRQLSVAHRDGCNRASRMHARFWLKWCSGDFDWHAALYSCSVIALLLILPTYLWFRVTTSVDGSNAYQVIFLLAEMISTSSVLLYSAVRIHRPWGAWIVAANAAADQVPSSIQQRVDFLESVELDPSAQQSSESLSNCARELPAARTKYREDGEFLCSAKRLFASLPYRVRAHNRHLPAGSEEGKEGSKTAFADLIHGSKATIQSPLSWQRYRVRILIPCYNEPAEMVRQTVLAALAMKYPAHMLYVYLCDDGADASKRQMMESILQDQPHLIGHLVYEARIKPKGQPHHGKAGNLNNVLTNIVYQQVYRLEFRTTD